jgi:hypothetical protein
MMCLATGCRPDPSGLVGTWHTEGLPRKLLADDKTPLDAPPADSPSPQDSAGEPYSIRLQFYRNGRFDTVTTLPNIQTHKSGKWRLVEMDPTGRTATIEFELMRQRTVHDVERIDADTIRLTPPNMAGLNIQLTFKRKR